MDLSYSFDGKRPVHRRYILARNYKSDCALRLCKCYLHHNVQHKGRHNFDLYTACCSDNLKFRRILACASQPVDMEWLHFQSFHAGNCTTERDCTRYKWHLMHKNQCTDQCICFSNRLYLWGNHDFGHILVYTMYSDHLEIQTGTSKFHQCNERFFHMSMDCIRLEQNIKKVYYFSSSIIGIN